MMVQSGPLQRRATSVATPKEQSHSHMEIINLQQVNILNKGIALFYLTKERKPVKLFEVLFCSFLIRWSACRCTRIMTAILVYNSFPK